MAQLYDSMLAVLNPLVAGGAHAVMLPQECQWPAIRFALVGATPSTSVCGNEAETDTDLVQIDVFAEDLDDVVAYAALIRAAMETLPWPVTRSLELDGFDDDARKFRRTLDFNVHKFSSTP